MNPINLIRPNDCVKFPKKNFKCMIANRQICKLSETVSDILESVKGRKQLTESLLLAKQSDNITRKQDRDIKAALFQFITDTQRKL